MLSLLLLIKVWVVSIGPLYATGPLPYSCGSTGYTGYTLSIRYKVKGLGLGHRTSPTPEKKEEEEARRPVPITSHRAINSRWPCPSSAGPIIPRGLTPASSQSK